MSDRSMRTVQICFDEADHTALIRMSKFELRHPKDQIRYIVRQALERDGWLPKSTAPVTEEETV